MHFIFIKKLKDLYLYFFFGQLDLYLYLYNIVLCMIYPQIVLT